MCVSVQPGCRMESEGSHSILCPDRTELYTTQGRTPSYQLWLYEATSNTLKMGTDSVPETFEILHILTRLSAGKHFIKCPSFPENFIFIGPCIITYELLICDQRDATLRDLYYYRCCTFRALLAHRQELTNCKCSLTSWHAVVAQSYIVVAIVS